MVAQILPWHGKDDDDVDDDDDDDDDDNDDEKMARHKDDLTASCTAEHHRTPMMDPRPFSFPPYILYSHRIKRNENITPKYCQYLNEA